jgi:hypothetical protein
MSLNVIRKITIQRDQQGLFVLYKPKDFYDTGSKVIVRPKDGEGESPAFLEGEQVHVKVSDHKAGLFYIWRANDRSRPEWVGPHWVQPFGAEGYWEERC